MLQRITCAVLKLSRDWMTAALYFLSICGLLVWMTMDFHKMDPGCPESCASVVSNMAINDFRDLVIYDRQ